MHFLTSVLLSLGSLALASPVDFSPGDEAGPPTSKSRGFNLIVNVTHPSRDFWPSVHGNFIDSIHIAAGSSLLGVGDKKQEGDKKHGPLVFYVNGTALDVHFAHSTVISDMGTPPAPWGIRLTKESNSDIAHTVLLEGGKGSQGVGLTRLPVPYTFLYPETYAICNESIPYYHGKNFLIVKQFQLELKTINDIPTNCVPVRLLPQCAKLHRLPKQTYSSHQWAYESDCYDNVAGIDWTKYHHW